MSSKIILNDAFRKTGNFSYKGLFRFPLSALDSIRLIQVIYHHFQPQSQGTWKYFRLIKGPF
jgi:hypothetical protein